MPATAIDLSKLPPPDVVESLDYEAILAAMKADAVARMPLAKRDAFAATLESEAEPALKVLQAGAYRELLVRNRVNQAARGNMLATAVGADLTQLAANLNVARAEGEEDDDLRARAALAPESWSVAGPELAYAFHAKSADPVQIADVRVYTPSPGVIRIVVLSTAADGVASPALLAAVAARCSDKNVRPLTDQVQVVSATVATWSARATLHLAGDLDAAVVEGVARAALTVYAAERRRLGRGVATDGVIAALRAPGVEKVVLELPAADVLASPDQAPVLGDVDLTVVVGGAGV